MYCIKCGKKVRKYETAAETGEAVGLPYGFVGGFGAGALFGSKAIVDSMSAATAMSIGTFIGGTAAAFTLPLATGALGAGALYLLLKRIGKKIDKVQGTAVCLSCGAEYVYGYNKRFKKTIMVPAKS